MLMIIHNHVRKKSGLTRLCPYQISLRETQLKYIYLYKINVIINQ